jgi:hypothetical protein
LGDEIAPLPMARLGVRLMQAEKQMKAHALAIRVIRSAATRLLHASVGACRRLPESLMSD